MLINKEFYEIKCQNWEKGTIILLVGQMVQKALEIANRGYVIQTGKILQSGKAKELLESDSVRKAYMGM